jgi:hypothetical protein
MSQPDQMAEMAGTKTPIREMTHAATNKHGTDKTAEPTTIKRSVVTRMTYAASCFEGAGPKTSGLKS